MQQYIEDVKNNTFEEKGWAPSREEHPKAYSFVQYIPYANSRIATTALARTLSRDPQFISKKVICVAIETSFVQILVNAVCPGFVATDFNGHRGHKTVDQGAETPVWAALLTVDSEINGEFISEKAVQQW